MTVVRRPAPATVPTPPRADTTAPTRTHAPAPGPVPNALQRDSYDRVDPSYVRPSLTFGTQKWGYTWEADALDEVMKRFCVGDAHALVKTAIALDCGDKYLSREELLRAAAREARPFTEGYKWSPTMLADVMMKRGIAEETALLRAATHHDDGDKRLERAELERAADVLTGVVQAHDNAAIVARVQALQGRDDLTVRKLGEVEGKPVLAVDLPARGESKLRVLVTGGVHGNEPCSAAAAMLLIEQLLANPKIRDDIAFTVVPVVNPRGLDNATRRTPEDVDLNRNFSHDDHAPHEAKLMTGLLKEKSFDLCLDLHSGKAKRDGFWALHQASEDVLVPAFERFARQWPVLSRNTKPYDMKNPGVGESHSPNTLKELVKNDGARWSVTLEAPGSISYLDQVLGENALVHEIIVEARKQVYAESAPGA